MLLKYEVLVDIEEEIEGQKEKAQKNGEVKKKKKKKEVIIKIPASSNRGTIKDKEEKNCFNKVNA